MRPRNPLVPLVALVGLTLLAAALPVRALERGAYELEILVDGVPLDELDARDTTYVEALAGEEYAVRLRNRTGQRIAVALSVDGLNTIDAKTTTMRDASKWILGPYETLTIEGWQTGASTARRFFFTTEDRSYGAWLGKTRNLGIVSAAVFRERRPRPAPIYRPPVPGPAEPRRKGDSLREDEAPAPLSQSAPQHGEGRLRREAAGADRLAPADEHAATGIGRELDHRVRRVRFEAEETPAAVLQIRYEYHDALVRLGVLPRPYAYREDPLPRRERARGFADLEFAPDPYRRR